MNVSPRKVSEALRVLSIGTDRTLFDKESAVRVRQRAFAARFDAFIIIVFSTARHPEVTEGSLKIMSTNSLMPLTYGFGALRRAAAIDADIVTAQDPFETGLVAWCIAWSKRIPLHVQVHTDPFSSSFKRHSFINRIRTIIARFVLKRASAVRVVSERVAESVERYTQAPMSVLPLYTDIARFESLPRLKHPRFKIALLFIGRLESEKGCMQALQALKLVRSRGHDAGLTIVGSGREDHVLREFARGNGLEQHVIFCGWRADVSSFLSEADALLVPSLYEGYGVVIVEALAAHVPVIAADVGVAREAGAIIAESDFTQSVLAWVEHGPRTADLKLPLIHSFDEYVDAWAQGITEVVQQ
ncbi:glycosyltransferase [bacterium]|nr:glycosyltransferase [bacterium]